MALTVDDIANQVQTATNAAHARKDEIWRELRAMWAGAEARAEEEARVRCDEQARERELRAELVRVEHGEDDIPW